MKTHLIPDKIPMQAEQHKWWIFFDRLELLDWKGWAVFRCVHYPGLNAWLSYCGLYHGAPRGGRHQNEGGGLSSAGQFSHLLSQYNVPGSDFPLMPIQIRIRILPQTFGWTCWTFFLILFTVIDFIFHILGMKLKLSEKKYSLALQLVKIEMDPDPQHCSY
jgi:hypothetical protein